MARWCMLQALKERGVQFIVAPYEADAQMAYMAAQGTVHAVITEDSDLIAYACPRVRHNAFILLYPALMPA